MRSMNEHYALDTLIAPHRKNYLEPWAAILRLVIAPFVVQSAKYVEGVSHQFSAVSGVLATAIVAQQHADVWDAAAMLLREHHT